MNTETRYVLRAEGLNKSYDEGAEAIKVLRDVNISVKPGEMVALVGASGSGKSTLLHVLGLLDEADSGKVWLNDSETMHLSEGKRSKLRNQHLGFVYQFHHLLAEFSALDNVAMPLIVRRMPRPQAREQAAVLLKQVGLADRMQHFPSQLSGGERQRVALARALVTKPDILLLDEPFSALQESLRCKLREELAELQSRLTVPTVLITHDPRDVRMLAETVFELAEGRVISSSAGVSFNPEHQA